VQSAAPPSWRWTVGDRRGRFSSRAFQLRFDRVEEFVGGGLDLIGVRSQGSQVPEAGVVITVRHGRAV
jgi:hypothetical protein